MEPALGDRGVVWTDYRAPDSDVYIYDFSLQADDQITSALTTAQTPGSTGIGWSGPTTGPGKFNVYMIDLSTSQEAQITDAEDEKSSPSISGDLILYTDNRSGNLDLFLYDHQDGGGDEGDRRPLRSAVRDGGGRPGRLDR